MKLVTCLMFLLPAKWLLQTDCSVLAVILVVSSCQRTCVYIQKDLNKHESEGWFFVRSFEMQNNSHNNFSLCPNIQNGRYVLIFSHLFSKNKYICWIFSAKERGICCDRADLGQNDTLLLYKN